MWGKIREGEVRRARVVAPESGTNWWSIITATLTAALTMCLQGCGGDNWAPVEVAKPLRLLALQDALQVDPGGTGQASFLLTTLEGVPAVGERLDFAVIDDPQTPGNDLAGATLGASSALTDDTGGAMVIVTGGLSTRFRLSARNLRAGVAEVWVTVSGGDEETGTVAVIATALPGSAIASLLSTVDVMLLDAMSCTELSATAPPKPARGIKTVTPGMAAEILVSNLTSNAAVIAQGRDAAGKMRATGCIDVPGSTVVPGNTVRVYVPLAELVPVPRGTFVLSSRFSLAKRDIATRLAAPWKDLSDCPLDPGQLWLDCAIDALGSPAGDPLDCVPAATGEGDLANLIMARRGIAVAGSTCRAGTISAGAGGQGLDARVAALFPSPAQPPAQGLVALGTQLASILDDVTLGSTLLLDPTATPGLFQATHTLRSAAFQVGALPATVDVVAQGIAAAQARLIPVGIAANVLSIDAHNLGLRLGSLAHAAFSQVALVGQGWPAATGAYLNLLFALAASGTGSARKTGCDALDALVCADVGRASGCLRAACVAGQVALAKRLDAGFALLDGDGADLQLSGSADMMDDNADGVTDRLGDPAKDMGLWTAQIRAHAGTEIVSGSWTGVHQAP